MSATPYELGDRLPTLAASRLRLRWLDEADVPALLNIFGDREVMRYWSHGPLRDLDAAREYLQEIRECFARRSLLQWGIELLLAPAETGAIIGTCTLADIDLDHRRAALGFALARAHWGHGYAAEAVSVLLDFAFNSLELNRISADADPRNARSIRTLQRLGFQREGMLREHYLVNGEKQDAIVFGLLRADFCVLRSE